MTCGHADRRREREHPQPCRRNILLVVHAQRDIEDISSSAGNGVDEEPEHDPVADALALEWVHGRDRHPLVVVLRFGSEGLLRDQLAVVELLQAQALGLGERRGVGPPAAEHGELRDRLVSAVDLIEFPAGIWIEDANVEGSLRVGRDAEIDRLLMIVVAFA